ncbi:Pre-mRNA-splicing factor 38A [Coemansia sp. Benny D115]|nr:Pre-mRNA-splicing factor 38A [Coemansia sp. Benny D115]
MANRTVSVATAIHGTNPQYLIDKTYRQRIYDSLFWKEHCFGLTVTGVMEKAVDLTSIGGCFGSHNRPTEFICLVLKLLQLQPDRQMLDALVDQTDFKYLRALALVYFRLTERPVDIYTKLEPLYSDYRKLRFRDEDGSYSLLHMDELIDNLLCEKQVCSITLPHITERRRLEDIGELPPRLSPLEEDEKEESSSSESDSDPGSDSDTESGSKEDSS